MTKTILDWFHDEICNMHFRTWDVPKKKKRGGNLSFRRSMFGSCPQVGKHRLSSISVTGKAFTI